MGYCNPALGDYNRCWTRKNGAKFPWPSVKVQKGRPWLNISKALPLSGNQKPRREISCALSRIGTVRRERKIEGKDLHARGWLPEPEYENLADFRGTPRGMALTHPSVPRLSERVRGARSTTQPHGFHQSENRAAPVCSGTGVGAYKRAVRKKYPRATTPCPGYRACLKRHYNHGFVIFVYYFGNYRIQDDYYLNMTWAAPAC